MNNRLTTARSVVFQDYQDIPRPVSMIIVEHDPEPSMIVPRHSHPRAQLAYSVKGTFTLHTEEGAWLVPPNRAVWVPGGVEHEMHARGQAVSNRSLYIQPDASPDLPTECCVIEVSPLMRHLIIEAIDIPLLYDEAGRASAGRCWPTPATTATSSTGRTMAPWAGARSRGCSATRPASPSRCGASRCA